MSGAICCSAMSGAIDLFHKEAAIEECLSHSAHVMGKDAIEDSGIDGIIEHSVRATGSHADGGDSTTGIRSSAQPDESFRRRCP